LTGDLAIVTIDNKVEPVIIAITGFVVYFAADLFPQQLGIARLFLYLAALLLLQSLLRDLWILSRRSSNNVMPTKKASCLCLESVVGIIGIVIGALFFGFGFDQAVSIKPWAWSVMLTFVLGFGFLIKDYVLQWRPWRIYQDKDHRNIVVVWNRE